MIGRDKISINLSRFHRFVAEAKSEDRDRNNDRKGVGGHQWFGERKEEENRN
jgi:hypothetical protein